ncbi:hypothetical protein M0813_08452 [Anaeramoeba flamelloides]|uniref:Uncharacterized protein n=1 Tax=Anaeramoeba flamelloides TaxID=1746091 RepID=A0ABQ8X8F5_9EUKA|nr:hypothetical protein M0813_08452 [Anaeramoeba flamelloides]
MKKKSKSLLKPPTNQINISNRFSRVIFSKICGTILRVSPKKFEKDHWQKIFHVHSLMLNDINDMVFCRVVQDLSACVESWVIFNSKELMINGKYLTLAQVIMRRILHEINEYYQWLAYRKNEESESQEISNLNNINNLDNSSNMNVNINIDSNGIDNLNANKDLQNEIKSSNILKISNNQTSVPSLSRLMGMIRSLCHFLQSYHKYLVKFGIKGKYYSFNESIACADLLFNMLEFTENKSLRISIFKALFWLINPILPTERHLNYLENTFFRELKKQNYFNRYMIDDLIFEFQKLLSINRYSIKIVLTLLVAMTQNCSNIIENEHILQVWVEIKEIKQDRLSNCELLLQHIFKIIDHTDNTVNHFKQSAIWFLGEYANEMTCVTLDSFLQQSKTKSNNKNNENFNSISNGEDDDNELDLIPNLALKSIIIRLQHNAFFGKWDVKTESILGLTKIAIKTGMPLVFHIYNFFIELGNSIPQIELVVEPCIEIIYQICSKRKIYNNIINDFNNNIIIEDHILNDIYNTSIDLTKKITTICHVSSGFTPLGIYSKKLLKNYWNKLNKKEIIVENSAGNNDDDNNKNEDKEKNEEKQKDDKISEKGGKKKRGKKSKKIALLNAKFKNKIKRKRKKSKKDGENKKLKSDSKNKDSKKDSKNKEPEKDSKKKQINDFVSKIF